MSINIAKTLKGPCVVRYKQADFFSQDDVSVDLSPTLFDVVSSAYGPVDQRIDDFNAAIQFSPMGVWDASIRRIYNQIGSKPLNDFLADRWRVTAVDTGDNTLEITAHGIPDGTPVRFLTIGGVMPTGASEATLYYTHADGANDVSLHTSQANAIAGTSPVSLTAAGSGYRFLIEQQPCRITSLVDGEYVEFHNAVVTGLPNITFGATTQLFGQMSIRGFPKLGVARADAESVFTIGNELTTANLAPAGVITQGYTFSWGAAPWDNLAAREGLTMSFQMQTADDTADSIGAGLASLTGLVVQVSGQPALGLTPDHLLAAVKQQGAGAVRGATLGGDDLDILGAGVFARLYNATLNTASLVYSSQNPRIGQLTWQAGRTVTSGVADPLFLLGTAAPGS